jgi:CRISPR-associated protein Cmr6
MPDILETRARKVWPLLRTANAGLILDRWLPGDKNEMDLVGEKGSSKSLLVKKVAQQNSLAGYRRFFDRWQRQTSTLSNQGYVLKTGRATAVGRMVVGLGNESVLETSITLHHTFGVPYIPGSALKGVTASYAHKHLNDDLWRKGKDAHIALFGDTEQQGAVLFLDALPVPQPEPLLHPDVLTPHHQDYYSETKDNGKLLPPADWDDPNPVPFLSAVGTYLVVLASKEEVVLRAAFDFLKAGLEKEGIGAKTSSGYGRLSLEGV